MLSTLNYARWAGISFVLLFIFGFYGLGYMPNRLFHYGQAQLSLDQILNHSNLLHAGISASILMNIASLFLALFVMLWLSKFSKIAGLSAALLLTTGALISLLNETNSIALLHWSEKGVLEEIKFYLHQYRKGIYIATLFWGLWLFPPAIAMMRKNSGLMIAGLLLFISGLGGLASA